MLIRIQSRNSTSKYRHENFKTVSKRLQTYKILLKDKQWKVNREIDYFNRFSPEFDKI